MADSTNSNPSDIAVSIEQQIKTIRDDISTLTKLIKGIGEEKVSDAMNSARGRAEQLFSGSRRIAEQASDRTRKTAGSVEDYIAEKPFQSAMIALLVGFLMGTMSRR